MSFIDRLKERLFGPKNLDYPEIAGLSAKSDSLSEKTENSVKNQTDVIDFVQNSEAQNDGFPERVLFVCSGNMCRSPYGAARFAKLAGNRKVQVISAGTLRITGRPAAPEMSDTARENGLSLENHRSSALSKMIIQASNLIFVMENIHRQEIIRMCPDAESRIVMLGRWLPDPKDELEDPMGKDPQVYRAVAREIDLALDRWFAQWA